MTMGVPEPCCRFHNKNCDDLEEACCDECPTWNTRCGCTVLIPPGQDRGLQFSAGCPLHGQDEDS